MSQFEIIVIKEKLYGGYVQVFECTTLKCEKFGWITVSILNLPLSLPVTRSPSQLTLASIFVIVRIDHEPRVKAV